MRRTRHIHFIGIGGSGMGGIAEVLHNQGYIITGSDLETNQMVKRLISLGIKITIGHDSKNIQNTDAVVITSAINKQNIELITAKQKGIPVVRRAEMLAELMRFGQGIAVAGCHGKTTTTSILASIMATANLDPTFVIGGKLNNLGANSKLGTGKYFIAEADESDASFLHLNPVIAIVTNIARDHMNTYGGDINNLRKAFVDFLHRLPFYGMAVLNIDDPILRSIIPELRCQVVTYGSLSNADYRLIGYSQEEDVSKFTVVRKLKNECLEFELKLPGLHNAQNALAALTLSMEENIDYKYIQQALLNFSGTSRRFQIYNCKLNNKKITLIDDYGHHPDEIEAMLVSIKMGWPNKRLVMIFQPHRYSRTLDLFDEFVKVLCKTSVLILLPVYPANELPIAGATSEALYNAIKNIKNNVNLYIFTSDQLIDNLSHIINVGDIVLVQGAGNVSEVTDKLLSLSL